MGTDSPIIADVQISHPWVNVLPLLTVNLIQMIHNHQISGWSLRLFITSWLPHLIFKLFCPPKKINPVQTSTNQFYSTLELPKLEAKKNH